MYFLSPRKRRWLSLFTLGSSMGWLVFVPGVTQAGESDLTGEWSCCGGSISHQKLIITQGTGTLAGEFLAVSDGTVLASVTGTLTGDEVKLIATHNDHGYGTLGYIQTYEGKVTENGQTITGKWIGKGPANDDKGMWVFSRTKTSVTPQTAPPREPYASNPSDPIIRIIDVQNQSNPQAEGSLEYFRDGTWRPASKNLGLQVGDRLRTKADTIASFEFLTGGRVGINKGVEIEITGERTLREFPTNKQVARKAGTLIKDGAINLFLGTLRLGGLPFITPQSYPPLEIQTNGGSIGIKG